MVGITYTDTKGNSTKIRSSTPSDAISRLQKIPGYAKTGADEVSASLAGGWRERHQARKAQNLQRQKFYGTAGGAKYSSGDGIVSSFKSITDVRVENGKIVTTSRDNYVTEEGKTIGIGPKKTETISVSGTQFVNGSGSSRSGSTIPDRTSRYGVNYTSSSHTASGFADSAEIDTALNSDLSNKVKVVVGVGYDEKTHQLYQRVSDLAIKDGGLNLSNTRHEVFTTAVKETV